jgi:hypothetical protein
MFPLGVLFLITGIVLMTLNARLAELVSKHKRRRNRIEPFLYSIKRQNIAFSGVAFFVGGLLLILLF